MRDLIEYPTALPAVYVGTDLDDIFAVSTFGNYEIYGRGGNDSLTGGNGNDSIEGQDDNDTLDGGTGADQLLGGAGDDTYILADADTLVELADQGYDSVQCALPAFTLPANFEELVFTGTAAARGIGNTLANRIVGTIAGDTLIGAAGADTLEGGTGDDVYIAGTGDVLVEADGAGTDTVRSSSSWTLAANLETLLLTGTASRNGTGNTLANTLTGNDGANRLRGQGGADTLLGQGGADTLSGGPGKDTLTGGNGNDACQFDASPGIANADTVAGFASGSDTLLLDDDRFTQFDAALSTVLAPEEFHATAGGVAHDADDRIVYDTASGALFYDPDGTGAAPARQFAVLQGHPPLAATDFLVIG